MSSLAFPIRMEKGLLRRCSEADALASLLEIVGHTEHGSWGGSKSFGTLGLTKVGATRLQTKRIEEALNRTLRDLGVTAYKVAAVEPESQASAHSQSFTVEFVAADEAGQPVLLRLGQED